MMTEDQAKKLILDTIDLVARYLAMTPTEVDDKIVAMIRGAIDSPLLWPWIWSLLERFLEGEELLVGDCPEPAAAAELGMDPLTIIALIKAVAEIIKLLRK